MKQRIEEAYPLYKQLADFLCKNPQLSKGYTSSEIDHPDLKGFACFEYSNLYVYIQPDKKDRIYITAEDIRIMPDASKPGSERTGQYQIYKEKGGKLGPELYSQNYQIDKPALQIDFPHEHTRR